MARKKSLSLAALGLVACVASYQSVDPIKDGLDAYEDIRAVQEFREAEANTDSLYQRIFDGGSTPQSVMKTIHENPGLNDEYFEARARRDSLGETPQVKEPLEDKHEAGNNFLYLVFIATAGLASVFVGVDYARKGETQ